MSFPTVRFRTAGLLKSSLFFCVFFFCLCLCAQTTVQQRLDKLIENTDFLQTSEVGIYVYDLAHDRALYDSQAGKLYRPASIQKLITSVSALSLLGADTLFNTSLRYTGRVENGILKGDLYVIGGFDPEFDDRSMEALVRMVDSMGIRKIAGSLYGDLSMTDSLYWGPGWSWDDTPYSFQPYLSPLMYNKGCVEVTATPGSKGAPASLSFLPTSTFYTVTNCTVSHSHAAGKFVFDRTWLKGSNALTVSGQVDRKQTDKVNLYTSQDFFMYVLAERLNRRGIATNGYAWGKCPAGTSDVRQIGTVFHSLKEALRSALKKSDNLSAEAIFRKLSLLFPRESRTSSQNGVLVVEKMISQLGMAPEDYKIADGSGVSLYNYVSPRLIVAFLKHAYAHQQIFVPLYESLPVAGVDGTLFNRMKQGKAYRNIHAKTGSVTGVSSLAGFVKMKGGGYAAFCIINQNVLDLRKARTFQDQVCEILAGE